jgi:hypothetical protein
LQISKKQQLDFGRAVSLFKGLRRCVQAAKQQAVRLSLDCANENICGLCPQPLKRLTKLL